MTTTLEGRRILVVEDTFLVAMSVEDMLLGFGCEVVGPAPNVPQAMALIEGQRIDGALLDVNLNGVMIFPVADALAERSIPFVLATGYDDKNVLEARFHDRPRLRKPYTEEDVRGAVQALFGPQV